MSDLRELYQEVILDHSRRPRNFGAPEAPARSAQGHNPLCGDRVTVYLQLRGEQIEAVHFEGRGCAISTASASLMSEALRGASLADAEALFARFHGAITSSPDVPVDTEALGKLAALAGVRDYPMRVKCASLAWHTLRAAIAAQDASEPVTTE